LATTDIDIAVQKRVPRQDRPPLADLLRTAGLEANIHPEHRPPIIKFVATANPNLEIEFLCPLAGSKIDRRGIRKVASEIQSGVTAQQLRYLDLLMLEPWQIDTGRVPELSDLPKPTFVRVPNPVAYVMQKILIRGQGRPQSDQEKDCGYTYEVAVTFRNAEAELHAIADRLKERVPKWWRSFEQTMGRVFGSPQAPGPVAAALQYAASARPGQAGGPVSEEMVFRAVARLSAMLAGTNR
jgi:hypothetical protein